jgi:hypothetical protein
LFKDDHSIDSKNHPCTNSSKFLIVGISKVKSQLSHKQVLFDYGGSILSSLNFMALDKSSLQEEQDKMALGKELSMSFNFTQF